MSHLTEAPKRPHLSIIEPVWQLHQGKIIDFEEAVRLRSLRASHSEPHTERPGHHEHHADNKHHEHGEHCNHDHESHDLLEPFKNLFANKEGAEVKNTSDIVSEGTKISIALSLPGLGYSPEQRKALISVLRTQGDHPYPFHKTKAEIAYNTQRDEVKKKTIEDHKDVLESAPVFDFAQNLLEQAQVPFDHEAQENFLQDFEPLHNPDLLKEKSEMKEIPDEFCYEFNLDGCSTIKISVTDSLRVLALDFALLGTSSGVDENTAEKIKKVANFLRKHNITFSNFRSDNNEYVQKNDLKIPEGHSLQCVENKTKDGDVEGLKEFKKNSGEDSNGLHGNISMDEKGSIKENLLHNHLQEVSEQMQEVSKITKTAIEKSHQPFIPKLFDQKRPILGTLPSYARFQMSILAKRDSNARSNPENALTQVGQKVGTKKRQQDTASSKNEASKKLALQNNEKQDGKNSNHLPLSEIHKLSVKQQERREGNSLSGNSQSFKSGLEKPGKRSNIIIRPNPTPELSRNKRKEKSQVPHASVLRKPQNRNLPKIKIVPSENGVHAVSTWQNTKRNSSSNSSEQSVFIVKNVSQKTQRMQSDLELAQARSFRTTSKNLVQTFPAFPKTNSEKLSHILAPSATRPVDIRPSSSSATITRPIELQAVHSRYSSKTTSSENGMSSTASTTSYRKYGPEAVQKIGNPTTPKKPDSHAPQTLSEDRVSVSTAKSTQIAEVATGKTLAQAFEKREEVKQQSKSQETTSALKNTKQAVHTEDKEEAVIEAASVGAGAAQKQENTQVIAESGSTHNSDSETHAAATASKSKTRSQASTSGATETARETEVVTKSGKRAKIIEGGKTTNSSAPAPANQQSVKSEDVRTQDEESQEIKKEASSGTDEKNESQNVTTQIKAVPATVQKNLSTKTASSTVAQSSALHAHIGSTDQLDYTNPSSIALAFKSAFQNAA